MKIAFKNRKPKENHTHFPKFFDMRKYDTMNTINTINTNNINNTINNNNNNSNNNNNNNNNKYYNNTKYNTIVKKFEKDETYIEVSIENLTDLALSLQE